MEKSEEGKKQTRSFRCRRKHWLVDPRPETWEASPLVGLRRVEKKFFEAPVSFRASQTLLLTHSLAVFVAALLASLSSLETVW